MGHLVRDLQHNYEIRLLPEIYKIVAKHLLAHRSCRINKLNFTSASFDEICQVVGDTESMVPLTEANTEANALLEARGIVGDPLIGKTHEQPGEMFNNLGQIEVLAKTVEYFETLPNCSFKSCAPTQQHLDRDKQEIADLEGDFCQDGISHRWALEAFGGKDLRNNSKLYKDLSGLLKRKSASPGVQLFLAFREKAWTWQSSQNELSPNKSIHMIGKPKGSKHKVAAQLRQFAKHKDVLIVEVTELQVQEDEQSSL